jgi:hypothetical protein
VENSLFLKRPVHLNLRNVNIELPPSSHSLCSCSLPFLRLFPFPAPAELPTKRCQIKPVAIAPEKPGSSFYAKYCARARPCQE